ncbi:DUF2071 domain-containing protein [Membranihabitans marinus]|uniref:DUF2071 domain-containing protein n=1 Tax=Membranihabitans marinus TaxID=1227546 RepID=UPI001F3A05C5|nr:DUF2071 domain-containing protein [Membranihabitans marinus]
MDYQTATLHRIAHKGSRSLIDVHTELQHLAIITYQIPANRLIDRIPRSFKLWTFMEDGIEYGLISAVTFKITNFSFYKISKYPKLNFFQTDFRTYIVNEASHAIWFFGTTLGSNAYLIPKYLWKMPCQYGHYDFHSPIENGEYHMRFRSKQGRGLVQIKDTNREIHIHKGFTSLEQQAHILTHAVTGYYPISQDIIGSYEIWHPRMKATIGIGQELYFEFFEKLKLLSKTEMNHPHSILMTPKIKFRVLLPPNKTEF